MKTRTESIACQSFGNIATPFINGLSLSWSRKTEVRSYGTKGTGFLNDVLRQAAECFAIVVADFWAAFNSIARAELAHQRPQ